MGTIGDQLPDGIEVVPVRGRRNRGASAPTSSQPSGAATAKKRVLKGRPSVSKAKPVGIMTEDDRKQGRAELEEFRVEITDVLTDCAAGILAVKGMSAADAKLNEVALTQREDLVEEYLRSDEPWRTIAVLVYAEAFVKACGDTKRAVQETVRRLAGAGFITDDVSQKGKRAPKNGVRVYDVNYVPTESFLYRPETNRIMKVLGGLERRATVAGYQRMQEERRQYRDDLTALQGMNTDPLTLDDLTALIDGRDASKASGMIVLRVPDRKVPDNRPGRSGKTRTLQGGHILFQVAAGSVSVLEGIGRVQVVARELQAAGAAVALEHLGQERFKLANRLGEEEFGRVIKLHKMLRQAVATAKQDAEKPAQAEATGVKTTAEAEEYRSRATLTAEEFFTGEVAGSFVLVHEKPWKSREPDRKGSTRNIVGLVTRHEDGKIGVECPERLKPFFGGCQEPTLPGERLEKLEDPLRGLLRWSRRMASKAGKPEGHSDEVVVTAEDFEGRVTTEAIEQA